MNRNKIIQICFVLFALIGFGTSGFFHKPLTILQEESQLTKNQEINKSSAEIRLIQAMPGFIRIFMIDYLWITTEQMKSAGKYYDAEQKTAMICALQPRFPDVWRNRSWNLAYNVSVTAHTSWERWRWISRGIELLRDKGIIYNPGSLSLYMELSWIYFHKLGEITDDLHADYWSFHAAEFHRVLGSPPKQSSSEAYLNWLRPIAEAPENFEQIAADPQTSAFIDAIKPYGINAGIKFIDAYNNYSSDRLVKILDQPPTPINSDRDKALQKIMTAPEYEKARQNFLAFSRSMVLRDKYKMRPAWMLTIAERFGPLDWRLVWPHSLYWASYGIFNCKDLTDRYSKLTTTRFMLYSLDKLMTFNKATLINNEQNPDMPGVIMQPDWRMIDAAHRTYIELAEFYEGEKSDVTYVQFQTGNENFLKKAIMSLFMAGQDEKAQYYFDYIKKHYSYKNPILYSLPLERFISASLTEQGISSRQLMAGFVGGLIENAYISLAYGYDEDYQLYINRAKMFWGMWDQASKGDARKALDPFSSLQARISLQVIMRMPLEGAMTTWEYLPLEAQQASYDALIETYSDICKQRQIDVNKAFPEPPGIQAYRKRRDEMIADQNRRRGDKPSEAETGMK